MKFRIHLITLFTCCSSAAAFGQPAKLEGRIFDDKGGVAQAIRIIAAGGQAATTDNKGHFRINFPASVQPGQAIRIEVVKRNWVIYQPMFGKSVTQSLDRNYELLHVIIVPKGSPLALSPRRLSQVIAQWTAERVKLRSEVGRLEQDLDEYAFFRQYAKEYGFSLDQFRDAAEQWAKIKGSDDKEERALKEYWQKHYGSAAQLAQESGKVAVEELKQANEKTVEASLKVIRRYKLAGNAYYAQYKFKEALGAYNEIEKHFDTGALSKDRLIAERAEIRFLATNTKVAIGLRVGGEESLQLLKEALADIQLNAIFYTREQFPRDWAAAQNSLGNVLSSLGVRVRGTESLKFLNEAVTAYRAALEVGTREELPQEWALTQSNLGNVLRNLGERIGGAESIEYLKNSIATHRAALDVRTRSTWPQQWATSQRNLGNSLRSLGVRVSGAESIKNLKEAVAAYRGALEVRTREQSPEEWAATQTNYGNALWSLGLQVRGEDGVGYLKGAVAAHRFALEVRTRGLSPQDWAATKNNLGIALSSLSELAGDDESIEYLKEAVAVFRAALEVRSRKEFSQDWASTQDNLGSALGNLGKRVRGTEGIKLLNQAVVAFRAALEVRTREPLPQQWAATQNNLGIVLGGLGGLVTGEEKVKYLNEAVVAYLAALEVRTREQFPRQWGATQNNLAIAYFTLEDWVRASDAYANSLTIYPDNEDAYKTALNIYHDKLFRFDKAFALIQEWLTRHPDDISARVDSAEAHFTTARFGECGQRITAFLATPDVPPSAKTALRAIEIACLLADNKASQVPLKMDALIEEVTHQRPEFNVSWDFGGAKHFVSQHEKLSPNRVWLGHLFEALANKDRDTILKSLKDLEVNFK